MNAVSISNYELGIKEYNHQRVVTFSDVDAVHKRPKGTASRNFRKNRKHFIDGEDYFRRNSSEARKELNVAAPNGLTLLTETGYLMLVKSFTDDLAWEVQRQLVKNYFRGAEPEPVPTVPGTPSPSEVCVKYFEGVQVMTVRDVERVTNVPKATINYHLRHDSDFIKDVDFKLLKNLDLQKFKKANKSIANSCNALFILTHSGVMKLAEKVLDLPADEQKQIQWKFKQQGKMNQFDEDMRLRYIRVVESHMLLDVATKMTDPFCKEFIYQSITEILLDEKIWNSDRCGFNGATSEFSVHSKEGWNKGAAINHSLSLMDEVKPVTPETLQTFLTDLQKKFDIN